MKIKEVCLRTGLTDRTVRFYIEEGLISPSYTENYLGRKAFDFCEEDVAELCDIAVLREFDFSVEEIRRILTDPESSREVIVSVKARTEARLCESRHHAEALEALDAERSYTVSELARSLSAEEEAPLPEETGRRRIWGRVLGGLRAALTLALILCSPVLGGVLLWGRVKECTHPVAEPFLLFLLVLVCFPSVFALVSLCLPRRKQRIPARVLLGACLCAIPLCAVLSLHAVGECTHEWSAFLTDTAASCTASGRISRSCERCAAVDFATTDPTGHTAVTDREIPPTCAREGQTEGKHCAVCGEVLSESEVLPRSEHTPVRTLAVPPTCTSAGLSEGSRCKDCGEVLIAQVAVEMVPHAPVRIPGVAPTCTSAGLSDGAHCEVCQKLLTAQAVIPETGHTRVHDGGIAGTCEREGLSDGAHCGVCGEVLLAQTVIPAGHKPVRVEGCPSTCTEEGKTPYSFCERCGTVLEEGGEYLPKLPHTLRFQGIAEQEDGSRYDLFVCRYCDYTEARNYVPPEEEDSNP